MLATVARDDAAITTKERPHSGVPCVFANCRGTYHPAGGTIGVVLCSPWGFEDLLMRKAWRLLAEAIAAAGFPVLRFDYPGTGNSLGRATDPSSVADWVGSIGAAADMLRKQSGVRGFAFLGQSVGAALAVEAARGRSDVVSLHLVAPVVSGRSHLRELALTSRVVAEKLGIDAAPAPGEALSVVGFPLSASMVESFKALDMTRAIDLRVPHATVWDQSDRKTAAIAFEHLRGQGAKVVLDPVPPYHLMISDATAIQPLPVASDRVVARLRELHPGSIRPVSWVPSPPATLIGEGFREEPIFFGPDKSLFGVLCAPFRPSAGAAAVVLLNRGLNAHIGWRRVSVDHARGLAAAGISSLRIDVAGLGESLDAPDRPEGLVYCNRLVSDISAAVDVLTSRGHARIALAGVCSGAYMALTTAMVDPRVTDVFAVNAQRFVWNPAEKPEELIRYGLRSVNDYVGDIRGGAALRKLLRSRDRIVPALRFLAMRAARDLLGRLPVGLRSMARRESMEAKILRFFDGLARNGTRVSLVFGNDDPGRSELAYYFGADWRDLRWSNVSISILDQADHNLTTTRASTAMLDHMVEVFGVASAEQHPAPAIVSAA